MQTGQRAGSPRRLWCWLEGRHGQPLRPSQTGTWGQALRRPQPAQHHRTCHRASVRPTAVKGGQSSWRKHVGCLERGPGRAPSCRWGAGPQAVLWNGPGLLGVASRGTGPPLPNSAYPGALGLDGFDVQAVLSGLAGAAGLGALLGALAAGLSAGLRVPVLLEQQGAEVHVVALLLGDVSVWAVHGFHVLPERAGVRVALGAAWDLADVGFLGEKQAALRTGYEGTRHGRTPLRKPCRFPWQSLAATAGRRAPFAAMPSDGRGLPCQPVCTFPAGERVAKGAPATRWGQRSEAGGRGQSLV